MTSNVLSSISEFSPKRHEAYGKRRHLFSTALLLLLLLSTWSSGSLWAAAGDSEFEPIMINSVGAWNAMAVGPIPNVANRYYELGTSLDLTLATQTIQQKGDSVNRYVHNLNGGGHMIYNLDPTSNTQALFGGLSGSVKNLSIQFLTSGTSVVAPLVEYNSGTITSCYSYCTVVADPSALGYTGSDIGGLVAQNDGGRISQSYFGGTLHAPTADQVGGVAGWNNGTIERCSSYGTVNGRDWVGGIAGWSNGSVTRCSSSGSVVGHGAVGGQVGYNNGGTIGGDSEEILASVSGSVTGTGDSVGGVAGYNMGGTIQNIVVGDMFNLVEVSGGGRNTGGIAGWSQVGTIRSSIVEAQVTGWEYAVGGVVGYLKSGSVENTWVFADTVSGLKSAVGGIAGYSAGSLSGCITLGAIHGNTMVGGLVGHNATKDSSVTGSYTYAAVSSVANKVGGLVGYNEGSISTCYNTGSVEGVSYVGGIVGHNDNHAEGAVKECYAIGPIDGTSLVGGIAGYSVTTDAGTSGTVTNCFWNIDTTGVTASPYGTASNTAAMKTAATYTAANWSLPGNWAIDERFQYDGYPYLAGWSGGTFTFYINKGAATTTDPVVYLDCGYTEAPFEYMASEDRYFSDCIDSVSGEYDWQVYTPSATFTLSVGNGTKTIYYLLRHANGSRLPLMYDTIVLNEAITTHLEINGGAATTVNQNVTLNNTPTGRPSRYRASEASDLAGADWNDYSTAPTFLLSAGNGTKTVYFQVESISGTTSTLQSDTIVLAGPDITKFAIKAGAANVANREVTLNNTCTGAPTEYMASEDVDFAGESWQPYATAPSFNLRTLGDGVKTVHFKVRNASGQESSVKTDNVRLSEAVVLSFTINNDDPETENRNVTLNNTVGGGAYQYMASESPSFVGAIWKTYVSTSQPFTLSAISGDKTVYFKIKNTEGKVSAVVSDVIVLKMPVVDMFRINSGDASVTTRTVTLNNLCTGSAPERYMASESATFAGATPQPYDTAPTFTLSPGNGTKKVYFKVQNSSGQYSVVKSDTIVFRGPAISTFAINAGAASTGNRSVVLNNTYGGVMPIDYMASEDPDFIGAAWTPYTKTPAFTLSAGDGLKTVYFKVRNAVNQESIVKTDKITLSEVVLDTFTINGGDATVNTRTVTLNNSVTGTVTPVSYMASESASFSGAKWISPYSATPAFTLSAANGTKKVYFKVKHTSGQVSNIISDIIILSTPVVSTLKLDDGAASTANATVALNNTVTGGGTITEYIASESATFATTNATTTGWLPYSNAPTFTFSSSKGIKTVYFKVKNSVGAVSPVKSDTINKTAVTTPAGVTANTATAAAAAAIIAKNNAATPKVVPVVDTPPTTPVIGTDVVTTATAKPNLQVVDYKLSDIAVQVGEGFTATLTISNDSNAAAGAFHVSLYLITDDMLLLGVGYLVDEVAIDGLAAQAETTATWNLAMPDLLSGVVYPVFVLDSQSEIAPFDATTNLLEADTLTVTK